MTPLEQVLDAVAAHLDQIGRLFKGEPKLTLLVRNDVGPGKDGDFVLTGDTLPDAIEALERRDAYDQPGGRAPTDRPKRRIPIKAARAIADAYGYGYDQVVIYGRRVGEAPSPSGEHLTTYGIDATHCDVAARMGIALKRFMGWNV